MSAAEKRKIMLGELLLRAGVITEQQLRAALTEQKKWGGKLGSVLVDMNFLDEDTLVKALSKQLGLPRVDFRGLVIDENVVAKLDAGFAEEHQVIPISYDESKNRIVVAMADPGNLKIVDELSFRTGCKIQVAVAGEKALASAIREKYAGAEFDSSTRKTSNEDGEPEMKFVSPLGNTFVGPRETKPRPEAGPVGEKNAGDDSVGAKIGRLESLQRKQVRILKVVVELLMEKGYFTRDEYRERVEK